MASYVLSVLLAIGSFAMSAALFIASAAFQKIVEIVVEKIANMCFPYLPSACWAMLPFNSESAIKRLQTALPRIRDGMSFAEELKMIDPSSSEWVRTWIEESRQAVDAAEDVLDELEYKRLKDMVKNRDEAGGSTSSKNSKTCTVSGDILKKLKKAVIRLDQVAAGLDRIHQHQQATDSKIRCSESHKDSRHETTAFLTERDVLGRDDEKNKIIGWLKRPTHAQVSSCGIVGLGGLGKTTLAQFACQEMRDSDYFDKIIWVCVSTEFSVRGITEKMLDGLRESRCSDKPLNVLQESLHAEISQKKILLVLDDVWEDEKREDWEQLIAPLRLAKQGSKILFTTRMESVAKLLSSVINTEHECLPLKDMGDEELGLIFGNYAFEGVNPSDYGDLRAIGNQVVRKLRGSPIAAKVIGKLLNSHMDQPFWRRISDHGSLINLDKAKDVMEVLKLSYYNLPADLQVCFRFCSIFPQDHEFDKKELIKMWMACGFIQQQSCQEERPEDIGENYFNLLLRKSFYEKSHSWHGERYVIHDLMHEVAKNVSNGECCRIASNDKSLNIPSSVRHAAVHESEIQKISHLENIRSLVITTSKKETGTDYFVLPSNVIRKSLRLLKIYGYRNCKLPKEINHLVHLRYLSIERKHLGCHEYLLPASIYELYHLQVLECAEASLKRSFSKITKTGITNLVRLRYMRFSEEIMRTICGVHRLTSLQELIFFVGKESGYRINELSTLNYLRHLTIYNTENIDNPVEARNANLLEKESLQSLYMGWTDNKDYDIDNTEQIIDNLQPPQNLRELTISGYKGQRSPVWLTVDEAPLKVSSLKLYRCLYLNNEPIFGKLPYLKVLCISHCPKIKKLPDLPFSLTKLRLTGVGLISLPNFPRVFEELTICSCHALKHIPIHAFRTCVSLKYLRIKYCSKLSSLPNLPLSLIIFEILSLGVSALPEYLGSPSSSVGPSTSIGGRLKSSLREVHIELCSNLTALNGFLEQDHVDFPALNKIFIAQCENLVQIPKDAFGKFESLTDLTIGNCPKLAAVEKQNTLVPSNLEKLSFKDCGELEVALKSRGIKKSTQRH
ncbi:Disease resistance protein RGA2 [Rhynchospora pubera]|uniref:Disease resistance protein RGA2 n=1 Tax=Rhynchospora pubera TaxID=906938 RepID=A0AAV8GSW6_9POAL|nr:Disease resistance protein RGA2 [Rhynchospora pubera]